MKITVCGKGGCGKSTVSVLLTGYNFEQTEILSDLA